MANQFKDMLTPNAIKRMYEGDKNVEAVLQILAYKKVNADSNNNQVRYRFIMSDGEHTHSAFLMIGPAFVSRIEKGEFERFTIIRLKNYVVNSVKDNVVIVMNDPVALKAGAEVRMKLGSPISLTGGPNSQASPAKRISNDRTNGNNTSPAGVSAAKKNNVSRETNLRLDENIAPIVNIHAFNRNWTIKGRVTSKGPMKTWNKPSGSGCLFSCDVEDGTGSIRVTAFNAKAEMYHPMIEVNKIYIFSKLSAKAANKQFSKHNSDYEMQMNDDTIVEERSEDIMVPKLKYNFIPIAQMTSFPGGSNVDVAAVVRSVGEVATIVAKATQKELRKREVMIVDDSNAEISLTLWGVDAEECKMKEGTVVVLRNAKVSEYNNRSLSTGFDGVPLLDPDMDVTRTLKQWYESCAKGSFNSMTNASGNVRDSSIKLLIQGESEAVGNAGGTFTNGKVTVISVGKTTSYECCPHESCKKKVMDMQNGYYRCNFPNCPSGGADIDNPVTRFVQNFQLADVTSSVWASCFHDELLKLVGMKAEEVKALGDSFIDVITEKTSFREFQVRLRFKEEFYKEETKVKATIMKMTPVDWATYSSQLVKMSQDMNRVL